MEKKRKLVRIILLTMISLLMIIGISSYLILHNYIGKINLVHENKTNTAVVETKTGGVTQDEAALESFGLHTAVGSDESEELEVGVDTNLPSNSSNTASEQELEELLTLDKQINENIAEESEAPNNSDVMNILLIGTDQRNSEEQGRSDSMVLMTLNKKTKTIIATSFLRDIYLHIPGKGNNRLNAAYASGGADLLQQTLEENFKFKIDHFIEVDFFTFIDIIDVIGGIRIEVEEEELPVINSYIQEMNALEGEKTDTDLIKKTGSCLMNGKQILCYTRNRYTKNGDFDRTERQRKVLSLIYEKISKQNLAHLNELLNLILPQVMTDFTESEIFSQFLMLPTYLEYELEEWSIPIADTYENKKINGMAVLGIDFNKNIEEIHQKLYENAELLTTQVK